MGGPAGRGLGAKGPRVYDWQCRVLAEPEDAAWGRYLLFRRSATDPADGCQAYLVYAAQRQACALETLVQVAGTRWCIESAFEAAKQEAGLDEYEVRSATGWYRHVTLALLAVLRATTLPEAAPPVKKSPAAVRRLLWQLWLRGAPRTRHVLTWLDWKRLHAWTAQGCHYRRQQLKLQQVQL